MDWSEGAGVRTAAPVESLPPFGLEEALDDTAYGRALSEVDLFLIEHVVGAVHNRAFYCRIKWATLNISVGAAEFAIHRAHFAARMVSPRRLPNALPISCEPAARFRRPDDTTMSLRRDRRSTASSAARLSGSNPQRVSGTALCDLFVPKHRASQVGLTRDPPPRPRIPPLQVAPSAQHSSQQRRGRFLFRASG